MAVISHTLSTPHFPPCFDLLQRPYTIHQLLAVIFLSLRRHPMNLETQAANPAGFRCTLILNALDNNLHQHFSELMMWCWTSGVWFCVFKPSEQPRSLHRTGERCRSIRHRGLLLWARKLLRDPDGSSSSTFKVCICFTWVNSSTRNVNISWRSDMTLSSSDAARK